MYPLALKFTIDGQYLPTTSLYHCHYPILILRFILGLGKRGLQVPRNQIANISFYVSPISNKHHVNLLPCAVFWCVEVIV